MKAKEVIDLVYMIAKAIEKIPEMWERFQSARKTNEYYSRQEAYDVAVKESVKAYNAGNVPASLDSLEEIG